MSQSPLTYMAKDQYQNLQMLDMLARWCLVIPVNSVSSEWVFSAAGGKISTNYNRRHPDKADMLMFCTKAQSRNLASCSYSCPLFTHM